MNQNAYELSFEDVSVRVNRGRRVNFKHSLCPRREERRILSSCSGHFPRGTVTALLGPSGAGKTTLLNVLRGCIHCSAATTPKLGHASGTVRFRGNAVTKACAKKWFSFVRQGSHQVRKEFTVAEQLDLACKLQLAGTDAEAKRQYRDELCRDLGILHTLHNKASNISGGERRRVSVALAMISRPAILILDEPTSGLDSQAALKLVKRVCLVSRAHNTTVIMSVHQPSSQVYQCFDRVIFLSTSYVLFEGKRSGAPRWFREIGYRVPQEKWNDADAFINIIDCPQAMKDSEGFQGEGEEENARTDGEGNLERGTGPLTMSSFAILMNCSERFRAFQKRRQGTTSICMINTSDSSRDSDSSELSKPPSSPPADSCSRKYLAPIPLQIPSLVLRELRFHMRTTDGLYIYAIAAIVAEMFIGVIVSGATYEGNSQDYITLASTQMTILATLVIIVFGTLPPLLVQLDGCRRLKQNVSTLEIEDGRVSPIALAIADEIVFLFIAGLTAMTCSLLPYALGGLAGGVFSVAWLKLVLLVILISWNIYGVKLTFSWLGIPNIFSNFMLFCFVFLSGTYIPLMSVPHFLQWTLYVNPGAWVGQAMLLNELQHTTGDYTAKKQAFSVFLEPSGVFTYELCALLMLVYGLVCFVARAIAMQMARSSTRG